MAAKHKKQKAKTPNLNRILTDSLLLDGSYKGIADNGQFVSTWCTGYSKPGRQVLYQALWSLANRELCEELRKSELVVNCTGGSILPEDKFELVLEADPKVKYDAYAVQVIATSNLDPASIAKYANPTGRIKGELLTALYEDAYKGETKSGLHKYSLGYIPRDRGMSKTIKDRIKALNLILVTKLTQSAPMKDGRKMYGAKINIVYGPVVILNHKLINIDTNAPEYRDMADIMEFI